MKRFILFFLIASPVFASENNQYCVDLTAQIEQVRQEQRRNSTQYLRDRYKLLTDLHSRNCMKG